MHHLESMILSNLAARQGPFGNLRNLLSGLRRLAIVRAMTTGTPVSQTPSRYLGACQPDVAVGLVPEHGLVVEGPVAGATVARVRQGCRRPVSRTRRAQK